MSTTFDRRRKQGLCLTCGGSIQDENFANCESCRIKHRTYYSKETSLYTQRKEAGLCPRCGEPRDTDKTTCSSCLAKRHKWYVDKRAEQLCTRCGKSPVLPNQTSCKECYDKEHGIYLEKSDSISQKYYDLKEQRVCTSCKKPLTHQEAQETYNGKPRATCNKCRAKRRLKKAKQRNWRYPHIIERDGGRCQICGRDRRLHVHHIDGNGESQNGQVVSTSEYNDDPENLITLCSHCHYGITCLRQAPTEKRDLIIKLILA